MKKKYLFLFIVILALLLSLAVLADMGNFNDYGGGGDWGGGDWGGSWDSGGSFGSFVFFGGGGFPAFLVIVIVFIVIGILKKNKANTFTPSTGHNGFTPVVSDNTEKIVPVITQTDTYFNKDRFIAYTKEAFITLQTAWSNRDLEKMRLYEKEELFKQHEAQVKEYLSLGRINLIERIAVNQAYLHKYERNTEFEHLSVFMNVRMTDYIKDEKTGKILKGNPNTDSNNKYILKFTRRRGILTKESDERANAVSCPHCGAPVSGASSGKCEYCGYLFTSSNHDWLLSDIEPVKPGMNIDNSGVVI